MNAFKRWLMACLILFGVGYTAYMITSSENKVPVVESEMSLRLNLLLMTITLRGWVLA